MASQCHSRSITGKPTRYFMKPHHNIGFNSKGSEDMAAEITKNRRFWPPQGRLRPPHHGTPKNIRMILSPGTLLSERGVPLVTFLSLIVWVYLLPSFHSELRKTHHLRRRVRYIRPLKVTKGRWFLDQLVIGPVSRRFCDTATYWLKIANFPSTLSFSPLDRGISAKALK